MKDIFIDVQIANRFANPPNEHYREFINWLLTNNKKNTASNAVMMLSAKLLQKYEAGCKNCTKPTSINTIIAIILLERRYTMISNKDIVDFRKKFVDNPDKKKKLNFIKCNNEDKDHILLIKRSIRKMMVCNDTNFINSVTQFPKWGKDVRWSRTPEKIPYK